MDSAFTSKLGYGLMNFTWKPQVTNDEQAFAAIKASVDAGSNFLNSGEFYGVKPPQANLQLLSRFYKANPDYADKTVLSVKGGMRMPELKCDASTEGLRRSVLAINQELGGIKKMDAFECARVDPDVPIEKVMRDLKQLVDEGHFKYINLSECSEKTIRRAAKVATISGVEVEYSPFSLDIERNGILAACKELSIPIIAYSPLGRGLLTGSIKTVEDIPEGDMRRHLDRFQPENFEKNIKLVRRMEDIAQRKSCTTAQLTLAWLMAQDANIIPIPGSTRPEGVKEALGALNVKLSKADLKEIREAVDAAETAGLRYNAQMEGTLEGDTVEE